MTKWEYVFLNVKDGESIVEKLNLMGLEGWRLVPGDAFLLEREINGDPVEPKFKGDDTIMVYMHDGPNGYGPCRFQNEVDVQNLAKQAPSNIYHFLHA